MEKIRLGKTDLLVSRVGIGGIPITRPPLEKAIDVIKKALNLGINFIDTAIGYSTSEDRIGQAIEDRRENVILATKTWASDRETALEHLETSLSNLRTDYLDLWQLHGIMSIEEYHKILAPGGAIEAIKEAMEDQRVRHIGFSSHSLEVALKLVPTGYFETVQFPFNFISSEPANELVGLSKKHDVGFIAMKPFAGGMIKDANLAMKYLLQYDNVVPDPGIEKFSDIEEIVNIVNGNRTLSPKEHTEIMSIKEKTGTKFCRQCEYCMPCPEGVLIHRILYFQRLQRLYELWPPERFFSWRYVLDGATSSSKCIECGLCETKCPYNLPIRELIKENKDFYKNMINKHKHPL
jgi:predicted aldo/keto reductase-like oxidoreductase